MRGAGKWRVVAIGNWNGSASGCGGRVAVDTWSTSGYCWSRLGRLGSVGNGESLLGAIG